MTTPSPVEPRRTGTAKTWIVGIVAFVLGVVALGLARPISQGPALQIGATSTASENFAVGSVVATTSTDAPSELWLPCDGRSIEPSEFPELLAVLASRPKVLPNQRVPDYRGMQVFTDDGIYGNVVLSRVDDLALRDITWWIKAK